MSLNKIDSKIRIKTTNLTGPIEPIIGPSQDHTDGTWDRNSTLQVYDNEFIYLRFEDKLFIGDKEIPLFVSGSSTTVPLVFKEGATNIITPTFGTNEISSGSTFSGILGGQNNTLTTSGRSTIVGGFTNTIIGSGQCVIGGGEDNTINGGSSQSTIVGGQNNQISGLTNTHIIGSNISAHSSNTTYVEKLNVKDGIEQNGTVLKTKVVEIGDWNMDVNTTKDITHGIASGINKIRSVYVSIRDDTTSYASSLELINDSYEPQGRVAYWDNSTIYLARKTGGGFDSVDHDSTSFNRGWVYITYEA